MPTFIYKGRTRLKGAVSGELVAENREEITKMLRQQGILATSVQRKALQINFGFMSKVRSTDLAIFTRQFATMINAGLPIMQCLEILREQVTKDHFRKIIGQVSDSVKGGKTLAEALAQHPKVFSSLYVHMVEAGELGGMLDDILRRLAAYLEKANALKRKIRGAMVYPALITLVACGGTIFMLTTIVPTFAKLFQEFGGTLPLPTRVVLMVSAILQHNFLYLVGLMVALSQGLRYARRTENGRYKIDKLLLRLPIFGNLLNKSAISRFSRTLGTLLSSGVAILDSLDITAKTAGNSVVKEAVNLARSRIAEGQNISDPLKASGVFPPMVTQMVAVGERTGQLDNMLKKIADFYDEQIDAAVAALTSVLEPIIVIFMGFIVGGILISMYLPMFDLISVIK
ncbi:MAG: pilus assembly protein PilC [candidate division Zixibacteria bacterium SM23_81]|nr:MAG: pilus assembly protein PilC [candidate division Zixibacteria bacterium SM23_81]